MLLVLPVPFRRRDGTLLFEQQACNGLRRWSEHFPHITIAAPVYPEERARGDASICWSTLESFEPERFTFLPLPWAYGYRAFFRSFAPVRRLLGRHIDQSTYLQFGIGHLVGDWAAVAAVLAIRRRRRFAIHIDRVEHQIIVQAARGKSLLRQLYVRLMSVAVRTYHRYLIGRCSLGLWHGADCFDEYARWCRESHLIHDIHCSSADWIGEARLAAKLAEAGASPNLRICYAGRMESMKGPFDWLQAIATARDLGVTLEAVWYGDGTLRAAMQERVERLHLERIVSFPGIIRERAALLAAMRSAHLLLYTHLTRESPRCLIEALLCGTPIIGYRSRFAEDLTARRGGGLYADLRDWRALAHRLRELAADRARLADLIRAAAGNGRRFNDVQVFTERSQLIKRYCPAN